MIPKFKAYDTKHKTIGRVIGLSRYEIIEDGTNLSYYVGDKSCLQSIESGRVKLLQFTGRLDSAGEEIYTGYVVEDVEGAKFKVVFSQEWCAYMLESLEDNMPVIMYPDMQLTIVGNIFQNP